MLEIVIILISGIVIIWVHGKEQYRKGYEKGNLIGKINGANEALLSLHEFGVMDINKFADDLYAGKFDDKLTSFSKQYIQKTKNNLKK